jgi:hypothetical protein
MRRLRRHRRPTMRTRLPLRLVRTPAVTRPGRLPRVPRSTEHGHRAPIGPDTLRAAYDAHMADAHAGAPGYRCTTCTRYAAALTLTRAHTTRTSR